MTSKLYIQVRKGTRVKEVKLTTPEIKLKELKTAYQTCKKTSAF